MQIRALLRMSMSRYWPLVRPRNRTGPRFLPRVKSSETGLQKTRMKKKNQLTAEPIKRQDLMFLRTLVDFG